MTKSISKTDFASPKRDVPFHGIILLFQAASGAGKAKGASLEISEFVAGIIKNGGGHYGYSSSHNHGSVENGGPLEDVEVVSKCSIFHFHDYGRKGVLG